MAPDPLTPRPVPPIPSILARNDSLAACWEGRQRRVAQPALASRLALSHPSTGYSPAYVFALVGQPPLLIPVLFILGSPLMAGPETLQKLILCYPEARTEAEAAPKSAAGNNSIPIGTSRTCTSPHPAVSGLGSQLPGPGPPCGGAPGSFLGVWILSCYSMGQNFAESKRGPQCWLVLWLNSPLDTQLTLLASLSPFACWPVL